MTEIPQAQFLYSPSLILLDYIWNCLWIEAQMYLRPGDQKLVLIVGVGHHSQGPPMLKMHMIRFALR